MVVLVDMNILLRIDEPGHSQHPIAMDATAQMRNDGHLLSIVPQTIYEYWAVATRPVNVNGLGLLPAAADNNVVRLKSIFQFLDDKPTLYFVWEQLVVLHQCSGKASYDARLVAAMQVHGMQGIFTFNTGDFKRYPGIIVFDPMILAAQFAAPTPATPKAAP